MYGLVLAGGGGKGSFQVGAYRALIECGLSDKILGIAGSSVGALNACLFAQNDIHLSENIWKNIKPNQFIRPNVKYFDLKEGIFGREGLIKIMDNNINYELVADSDMTLYSTVSQYDELGLGTPIPRYFRLNGKNQQMIQKILLASSAIPGIYEPVKLGEYIYRDGGITDNLPIEPLYRDGIRKFIVITLSTSKKIPYDKYPDAEFILIKPSHDLGDDITGTMDFTSRGAKIRMKLGYEDAIRTLMYYNSPESKEAEFENKMSSMATISYNQIMMDQKMEDTENIVKKDIEKLNQYVKNIIGNIDNL